MAFKTVTAQQMKKIDRMAIEGYGIPGIVLMENAGIRATEIALQMLAPENKDEVSPDMSDLKNIVVFCGKGNNGGDGFVISRHLLNKGFRIRVYLAANKNEVKSDALVNLNILLKMGQQIEEVLDIDSQQASINESLHHDLSTADLVIDALLGTGVSGHIKEPYLSLINMINEADRLVLAVDTPSGLDVDTGKVLGACVKATKTVTFGLAKKGFYLNQGPEYVGELIIADISLPRNLI